MGEIERLAMPAGLDLKSKFTVHYHHTEPVFPDDDGWRSWNDSGISREAAEQQAAALRDAARAANSVNPTIDKIVLIEWTPEVRRIGTFGAMAE